MLQSSKLALALNRHKYVLKLLSIHIWIEKRAQKVDGPFSMQQYKIQITFRPMPNDRANANRVHALEFIAIVRNQTLCGSVYAICQHSAHKSMI